MFSPLVTTSFPGNGALAKERRSDSRFAATSLPRDRTLPVFSFFSGVGFLDLGFESEGFDPVFVNEYSAEFLRAYKYARQKLGIREPEFGYSCESIEALFRGRVAKALLENIERARSRGMVGFIGGPPCPDFSIGGKNRGHEGENGRLTGLYFSLIRKYQPDWFLFENVKGLWKTRRHREFYDSLKKQMQRAGYALTERLINAIEYGVAQDRERVILIGIRSDVCEKLGYSPANAITEGLPWQRALKYKRDEAFRLPWPGRAALPLAPEAFDPADLPEDLTVEYWFRRNSVTTHPNSKHGFRPRAGLARFMTVDEGDDSRKSYKRLHRFRYSPTACYGNNEVHIHPEEPRRITAAEALAIQSLPSDFELPPDMSLSAMFKTIGNGVPFLAAKGLAATVKQYLKRHEANGT